MDDERIKKTFGNAVRRQRRRKGVSQEKLAELADLHRTYISDVERGDRNVSLLNIVRLATALGIDPDALFDGLRGLKLKRRRPAS